MAFLLAKQSSTARDCERELKAAIKVPLENMTTFHLACEKGWQLQARTNGLLLLPGGLDRPFARRLECRAGPPGKESLEYCFCQIRYTSPNKNKKTKQILREHSTLEKYLLNNGNVTASGVRRAAAAGG